MPLEGLKLFGSTVKSFESNLGWGNQKGSVRVSLVQDTYLGDYFLPPPIGAPSYVTFGALNFWGILQKWERTYSTEGVPTYEVMIEDPRDILDGTEVILSLYNGNTYGVPNLINVFGYCENLLGFGGSQVNDSGMPWNLVRQSLLDIINVPFQTNFGGPLKYKGYSYYLDLSQLPLLNNAYRIGGGSNLSLMSIITQVCQDAGLDFFIDMTPGTNIIRVRTITRRLQPPVGYIQAFVDAATTSGDLVSSNLGLEARNENSSAFLIGGEVTTMYESEPPIRAYFGKDINNNPIIGRGSGYSLTANLNALEVRDIIGANAYSCTALEMCCALADINTWLNYMYAIKPTYSTMIGIIAPNIAPELNIIHTPKTPVFPADALNLTPQAMAAASGISTEDVTNFIVQRMYNFVLKNAQEYLGKKYLVELPFVFVDEESETGRIVTSYEITDAGYLDTGIPLNLSPVYQDNFRTTDGRFQAMAVHDSLSNADLSRLTNDSYLMDIYNGGRIFIKVGVDNEIVFIDELTPCAVVNVDNPIYQSPVDATGAGIAEVAGIFQMTPEDCANLMNSLGAGNFFGKIAPLPVNPTRFAIPLKSNILSYGPWYVIGAHGKVNFIHDSGLVPWNYGSLAALNIAGAAKVQEALTYQQAAESGTVDLVGLPTMNIGDQLQITSNALLGPSLTSIQVRYDGARGVTSSYRFQTFSANRLGTRYKGDVESFKRAITLNNKLNRDCRQLWRKSFLPQESAVNKQVSAIGAAALKNWPSQFQRNSPHAYLIGMVDNDTAEVTHKRTSVTTTSDNEFITSVNISADYYPRTAAMSLTGIVRPFSTQYSNTNMACYESPNIASGYSSALKGDFLDPFKSGNDVEVYISGDSYTDAHAYLNDGPTGNIRGFALRAPLLLTGWGWCTDDAFVPNANPTTLTGGPLTDYLRKSTNWKTGPVDLLWDDERKVWTPHGFMCGKTTTNIAAGSSGEVQLWNLSSQITGRKKNRTVYNFFSRTVPTNTKIQASWCPEVNGWVITAADCP